MTIHKAGEKKIEILKGNGTLLDVKKKQQAHSK